MFRHVNPSKATPVIALLSLVVAAYLLIANQDELLQMHTEEKDVDAKIEDRRKMFLAFVGGMPRSGTTLMRTILDTHPLMRCGLETRVIPDILNYQASLTSDDDKREWLSNAGVYPDALENAVAQFILEIILRHGPPAPYYCNKDPYTLGHTGYLRKLFPNSKFIMMVRDGRAFAHSVVSRGISIAGYDITNYRDILTKWSLQIQVMNSECLNAGKKTCLPVHYEKLVLQPVATTKQIFRFLEIPWDDIVLHHEDHLNETELSVTEYSTSQVKRPINLDALSSWVGQLPKDVEHDLPVIAPMLRKLGYDPTDTNPNYGEPDEFVKRKIQNADRTEKKKQTLK